ncbi:MAG: MFS transporter [Parachlamydiaceae bacterium]
MFYFSLAITWIGHFLVDMMLGIWPVYKTLAHVDIAVAGIISGACAFLGEGLQLLFGALSDRGYRKHLILGGVIAAAASSYFVYTESYLWFFALYLVTCIGSGAFHPCAASLIGDLPSERKGMLLGVFASGGALGLAFSQIIFVHAHTWLDGHTAWLTVPAVVLLIVALMTTFGRQSAKTIQASHRFSFKAVANIFKQREICLIYLTLICSASLLWAVIFLLPDILSSRGYEPWIAFGGGHMAFILGGALTMMPAGYLADKYSSRFIMIFSMASAMTLYYLFILFPMLGDYSVLTVLFGMGAAVGVVQPVGIAMGSRLLPQRKGMVSAVLMGMVWCVAEGLGQTGGGFLVKCFSEDAAAKSLAILSMLFLVGTITAFLLPQTDAALEPIPEPVNYV